MACVTVASLRPPHGDPGGKESQQTGGSTGLGGGQRGSALRAESGFLPFPAPSGQSPSCSTRTVIPASMQKQDRHRS